MPMYIISATLSRHSGGISSSTIMQGYRLLDTEEQAIGSFVKTCNRDRPGYAIEQIIALEIPMDHLLAATQEGAVTAPEAQPESNNLPKYKYVTSDNQEELDIFMNDTLIASLTYQEHGWEFMAQIKEMVEKIEALQNESTSVKGKVK